VSVSGVHRSVVEGSVVGSGGLLMFMCMGSELCSGWLQCTNVAAILNMGDMVCLACMQKLWIA